MRIRDLKPVIFKEVPVGGAFWLNTSRSGNPPTMRDMAMLYKVRVPCRRTPNGKCANPDELVDAGSDTPDDGWASYSIPPTATVYVKRRE